MRKLFLTLYFLICYIFSNSQTNSTQDFTKYVRPIIGTGGHGHTYPGPTTPFGKVQLSPDNKSFSSEWDWCSGYHYSDSIIVGFSHTHLAGTGVSDLGDILIMPSNGKKIFNDVGNESYASKFSHITENVELGYYKVFLNKPKVKAELTTSHSVGFHQYTFPKNDSAAIVLDLHHKIYWGNSYESFIKILNDSVVVGQRNTFGGWASNKHIFFAIKFDKKFYGNTMSKKVDNRTESTLNTKFNIANEPKAAFYFKVNENEQIKIKVAISTISIDNALENMNEISDWDFNKQVNFNKQTWNNILSKIKIEGTQKQKEIFYTSMYHAFTQPNQLAENGEYFGPDYIKHKSSSGQFYSTFSLWDTYRAAHPLYTILVPDKVSTMIESMMENYKYNHYLPMWTLWGIDNNCMIANHSIPVITDAYFKGLLTKKQGLEAYKAMIYSSTVDHPVSQWSTYIKHGYYPSFVWENISKTLESCFNDWCVLQMAMVFGTKEEIDQFQKRANNYKNIFNPKFKLMWPKNEDGTWKVKYSPKEVLDNWRDVTEGNSWQYTWSVQHDPKGLINLFGSEKMFLKMLDSTFDERNIPTIDVVDVSGLIGEYAHGNEPSHHIAYLYNYVNKPKKTQELINKIINTQYQNTPDGICGNEDCGQMSAWYIFNTMGMYPLNPASGNYDIGAPQVPYVEISLQNDKKFIIKAINLSDKNKYVKSIKLMVSPLLT